MIKARLLFRKEGRAQYISHLDLMHTMQRAFIRAGVRIRHTEGFNPHPYMSFLLPLPVGCESVCELMDFDLEDGVDPVDVPQRLNDAAPEGITAVEVYPRSRKGAELKWLRVEGILEYDAGVPEDACRKLSSLFAADPGGLSEAIGLYAPALRPDYSHFRRLEVYDGELSVFR